MLQFVLRVLVPGGWSKWFWIGSLGFLSILRLFWLSFLPSLFSCCKSRFQTDPMLSPSLSLSQFDVSMGEGLMKQVMYLAGC